VSVLCGVIDVLCHRRLKSSMYTLYSIVSAMFSVDDVGVSD
jgi:hypothetical protein